MQLQKNDLIKGLLMAIGAAITTALYQALEAGTFSFTWAFFLPVIKIGIGAGLLYLLKNFFTNKEDKFLKADPKPTTNE